MNKTIVAVLMVIILALVYFGLKARMPEVTELDARKFVVEDMASKYGSAESEILSASLEDGSWLMQARVTLNKNSPCPERINLYYDYPRYGFVTRPPEYITKDCKILCEDKPTCALAFEEQAVIASHTFKGTEETHALVMRY
ncbi:MAG: hypothetical protein ABIH99_03370, partial [Candidatus Micrarchaeota archaeon]